MVTFARLLPMPLLSVWLYHAATSRGQMWAALIVGTLIGCTDFVDGYLARKQGPTVLGGLIDPSGREGGHPRTQKDEPRMEVHGATAEHLDGARD